MAKKPPVDLFGSIAQPAGSSGGKKTDKPTAAVTADIKAKVDELIRAKAQYKQLEQQMADLEAVLIGHVRPQQDALAFKDQFTKSMVIPGKDGNILMVTSDKFSAIKEPEVIEAMKAFLGEKDFDATWPSKRTITLKKDAAENKVLIEKFFKAIQAAGLEPKDVFDVVDCRVACEDLDEKQYKLCGNQTRLETFRTMAHQAKPALK